MDGSGRRGADEEEGSSNIGRVGRKRVMDGHALISSRAGGTRQGKQPERERAGGTLPDMLALLLERTGKAGGAFTDAIRRGEGGARVALGGWITDDCTSNKQQSA